MPVYSQVNFPDQALLKKAQAGDRTGAGWSRKNIPQRGKGFACGLFCGLRMVSQKRSNAEAFKWYYKAATEGRSMVTPLNHYPSWQLVVYQCESSGTGIFFRRENRSKRWKGSGKMGFYYHDSAELKKQWGKRGNHFSIFETGERNRRRMECPLETDYSTVKNFWWGCPRCNI